MKRVRLDVWTVDKAVGDGHALTWNNAPKPIQHIGTVTGVEHANAMMGDLDYFPTINETIYDEVVSSMKCEERMTFRLIVPEEVIHGGVQFKQQEDPFGGWLLRYNC